jgi:hypothetical protein
MATESTIYVRLIDGVECFAPVAARENPDGTFCLSANPEFDAEDTGTLFEFLPGDVVRVETRLLSASDRTPAPVAVELVSSSSENRDYWTVLFCIASGAIELPALGPERLRGIAAQIRSEVDSGARWHYPSVVDWARSAT